LTEKLEKMSAFFEARINEYEHQMLENAEGCREAYIELARLLPKNTEKLLDLGCGTGLELAEIFRRFPDMQVTGIDLTQAMLDVLARKFSKKNLSLICCDYLQSDLGAENYDAAISFETMHHLHHEDKRHLYKKIWHSLKSYGVYIEVDYMVMDVEEEQFFLKENQRLRNEQGISHDELYHYDIPFTIGHQKILLSEAGFRDIKQVFRMGATTILVCKK